jgi:hypothetical protein
MMTIGTLYPHEERFLFCQGTSGRPFEELATGGGGHDNEVVEESLPGCSKAMIDQTFSKTHGWMNFDTEEERAEIDVVRLYFLELFESYSLDAVEECKDLCVTALVVKETHQTNVFRRVGIASGVKPSLFENASESSITII